ncbi:MAG: helix-turn-helix transcriptional regulator [Clostridia bacterium]|nr:helix-turn-helix transcriptional regulator [Clostridia bacterium]
MILADKIIKLRKKNGWSQEELAEKMNVSRQAVSKWESAQAIPDLEKILQLGALFGVTTDYLLKDNIENEEFTDNSSDSTIKIFTLEEANTYLEQRKRASWHLAVATFLCILAPITLIVLSTLSGLSDPIINEQAALTFGLIALFAFLICAVPIYIYCGFMNEPYAFLEQNTPFELEYGVKGIVTERKKKFRDTYIRFNIIASCVCIFSPIPLIVSSFTENAFLVVMMLTLSMIVAGIGVGIFIVVGVRNASMQKLLQEGDFSKKEKGRSGLKETVGFAYWGILTAIYLAWSFLANHWHISWLIYAIGGVLFPIVMMLCNLIADKNKKD